MRLIDRFVAMRRSQVYGLASPRKPSILSRPRVNVSCAEDRGLFVIANHAAESVKEAILVEHDELAVAAAIAVR